MNQGVVCSGIAYYAQGVVIREQGPVFVTAFSPLCMIITAALGSFILAEKVHLGRYFTSSCYTLEFPFHYSIIHSCKFLLFFPSIIGTVIIIFGLYTVLWGKSKDQKNSTATENGEVQELPTTDDSKSTKLEDSMELPATILKIPAESRLTRDT